MPVFTIEQIRFTDWQMQHSDSATLWEALEDARISKEISQ